MTWISVLMDISGCWVIVTSENRNIHIVDLKQRALSLENFLITRNPLEETELKILKEN